MTPKHRLRLGTRGSALARWQAEWVASELKQHGVDVELILISTKGDQRSGPIGNLGSQGVFTKEIQQALLDDQVDLAVHSLKDLPTEHVEGLALACVPTRASNLDVLVSNQISDWTDLPEAARIGTGSARRRAQLLHARPDLRVLEIRGNVDTRLRKLDEGQYDAIILAEAGLRRLGLESRIAQVLPASRMLPAVGQGALGIETRREDRDTWSLLQPLNDAATHQAVLAERAALAALRGGCLAPIGAWGRLDDGLLRLDVVVLSQDGTRRLAASGEGPVAEPETLGQRLARQLLDDGADQLLALARAPE